MTIRGWVYVITNKAMPDLVKVGFSTKDPTLRAKELAGTGTPHPYEVAYDALVLDPRVVEQKSHKLLTEFQEGKEWYRCSIHVAIQAIKTSAEVIHQETVHVVDIGNNLLPRPLRVLTQAQIIRSGYTPEGSKLHMAESASATGDLNLRCAKDGCTAPPTTDYMGVKLCEQHWYEERQKRLGLVKKWDARQSKN